MAKWGVVVAIVVGCIVARRMHQAWAKRIAADSAPVPTLPLKLLNGSDRTWVIFTTRFCAQCGPVERLIKANQPETRVVTVDAEREPHLAKSFRIASAPTALLADANGNVLQRLVGAAAVTSFVQAANQAVN